MHTEQLRYFILAYERKSYSQAGREIPLTPKGVAKAVHSLENELGATLFEAGPRGMLNPTAQADRLYVYAVNVLKRYDQLEKDLIQIGRAHKETVKVGLANGALGLLGYSFWERFEKREPYLSCELEEVPDLIVDERLESGFYDVAFTTAPYSPAFETVELYRTPLSMWVNQSDPLSKKPLVAIEDLEDHVLATPGQGYKAYERIRALCVERDVTPRKMFNSSQMYWIFEFVRQGQGIGTNVGPLVGEPLFSDPSVVSLPFEDFTLRVGVSWKQGKLLRTCERKLIDYACSNVSVAGISARPITSA
ncbi:LysR family transcriptional regulator [Eggerthella sp. YY7918]|uniref:LysR family transcriptional regulator n=1 Tax=Eggerthella sp. (strain YY7918) TaxID=502558 RepID=UPI0002171323|nr:LysR family transcriptional regulator [Eggerthella sp. YY7918]BAK45869.1 hypothetical protein EGYY_29040 [Eggerthella sp. YY7918]